jgi:rRNA maturation RNase YbeY
MHLSEICFSFVDVSFDFVSEEKVKKWISNSLLSEGRNIGLLTYVFCNDCYLQKINAKYLKTSNLTDVIAFAYDEHEGVCGDVFISTERVEENAKSFNKSSINEMSRVMLHGALHLIGYNDKTKAEKQEMTRIEDKYLSLHPLFK